MTLFPRDINIDQLGVRSLFGCLCVYVTKEKAYNLVSFSAWKMFFYFFPTQNSMRNSLEPSDFIFHHCFVEKTYKNKL